MIQTSGEESFISDKSTHKRKGMKCSEYNDNERACEFVLASNTVSNEFGNYIVSNLLPFLPICRVNKILG